MADLFDAQAEQARQERAPLADRMRPRTLDEFVGQDHILGEGKLLRRAIEADRVTSVIFYGPPGTGKTTLARIIANTTEAHFTSMNAVLSGVKDIREAIQKAKNRLRHHQTRTILFVDEVHRFNKSQQDALLPHVENGTVVFVGATTENPYFEVNNALVSRSRVFELQTLDEADLRRVAAMAITDAERGYGNLDVTVTQEAMDHLVSTSNGDARSLLNALELGIETTRPDDGTIYIDLQVAEDSIQQRAVLYDKEGDAHFDTISAFIKSLRGSDPDAALYWLARMVYAGEDPRFILRRMLIFAAEDIGLADPEALKMAQSAAAGFEYVGMPEGQFLLAECCLYLATAPKSNTAFAYFDALEHVKKETSGEVPDPMKDANRDKEGLGHGKGYKYPHAYREHYTPQQYLPNEMQGVYFYQPTDQGYEEKVAERLAEWRDRDAAEEITKRAHRYAEDKDTS
ncbi:AAA family ATPase [Longibacter salinarum]|uniref:Replication-associated recombination protein A n=1 Tax=Longibacter salinarum TaxID=1850348 RepID=A0A2A8CZZ7_9BACT|nr:AAA family ATPase [Longibacter salinarum]PEN14299.1 AAA family ATPase [Longibacter salinarum]